MDSPVSVMVSRGQVFLHLASALLHRKVAKFSVILSFLGIKRKIKKVFKVFSQLKINLIEKHE
jgi:hypothetical protein